MPSFDKYEDYSKTLFIRFKCSRCGFEELETLEHCDKRTGDRGNFLRQLSLPKGWYDDEYRSVALCPNCRKAYEDFMSGNDVKRGCWELECFECTDKKFLTCSNCNAAIDITDTPIDKNEFDYCPYCGAKMDGDVK